MVVAALGVLALLALPVLFFGWVTLQAGEREVLVLEDDAPASTTTVDGPAAVPGEAVDQWSWRAGEVMAVVGLAHDDVLELRSDPGLGYPVLAELDAGAADLVVTGNGWVTPDNEWLVEVRTGDEGVPVTVMSAAPTIGDRAEVTYDVIGYADDAELGDRVRVFATRSDSGDGFVLASVEATALCSRGVQAGMCL